MIDIHAIKARLSDPREVARLLKLRVEQRGQSAIRVRCPVHNGKSGSMRLRCDAGVLRMNCYGCGIFGDVIDLLGAIERDPRRGLERAAELAGGAVAMAPVQVPQDERLPAEAYHELAERILEAGRLDGRPWAREVEAYLAERCLLDLARADGWACLPGLNWLLQIAEEVVNKNKSLEPKQTMHFDARDLLIRAKLARYNDKGEFVPTWGRWRLVIPWRGLDGRISALQRRRTWKHVPRDANDPEPAKYVLPWLPEWPYGSERIGGGDGLSASGYGQNGNGRGCAPNEAISLPENAAINAFSASCPRDTRRNRCHDLRHKNSQSSAHVAIVEGAVDTLAMRAIHPSFAVLGVPGINSWRPEWASTIHDFRTVRYALDRGKPRLSDGLVSEDIACARIALDVAVAMWQKPNSLAQKGSACKKLSRQTNSSIAMCDTSNDGAKKQFNAPFAFPFTNRIVDWLLSRYRRGKSLFCVLCGAPEPWLCRWCGRRRAPDGMDWGDVWRLSTKV